MANTQYFSKATFLELTVCKKLYILLIDKYTRHDRQTLLIHTLLSKTKTRHEKWWCSPQTNTAAKHYRAV